MQGLSVRPRVQVFREAAAVAAKRLGIAASDQSATSERQKRKDAVAVSPTPARRPAPRTRAAPTQPTQEQSTDNYMKLLEKQRGGLLNAAS